MRRHTDLERAASLAVLCAVLAIVVPWEPARAVAALPLALFLPGYATVAAAFGAHSVSRLQVLMLSLSSSLAILALGGLLLNYLPGGIRTASWALLLAALVIAACVVAALRRPPPRVRARPQLGWRVRRADLAVALLATAVAIAALVFASTPLPAGKAAGYTALWMLPERGGAGRTLKVGTISAEQHPLAYRLELRAGGARLGQYRFALDPGEEKTFRVRLGPGSPRRVEASLFRGAPGFRRLYRRVTTWLPGHGRLE